MISSDGTINNYYDNLLKHFILVSTF